MITSKDESSLIFERQTVVLGNLFLQPSFVRKEYLFFTTKLIARMIHWIEKRKCLFSTWDFFFFFLFYLPEEALPLGRSDMPMDDISSAKKSLSRCPSRQPRFLSGIIPPRCSLFNFYRLRSILSFVHRRIARSSRGHLLETSLHHRFILINLVNDSAAEHTMINSRIWFFGREGFSKTRYFFDNRAKINLYPSRTMKLLPFVFDLPRDCKVRLPRWLNDE